MRVWCVAFVACIVLVASVIARPGSKVNRHKRSRQMFEDEFEVPEPRVRGDRRQYDSKFIENYLERNPIRNQQEEKSPGNREDEDVSRSSEPEDKFDNDEDDYSDNDYYYDDEEGAVEDEDRSQESNGISGVGNNAKRPPPSVSRHLEDPSGHEETFSEETNYDDLSRENLVLNTSSRGTDEDVLKLCNKHCSERKLSGRYATDIRKIVSSSEGSDKSVRAICACTFI